MAAGKYKITICQGADLSLVMQWLDKYGLGSSLSGHEIRMQIRSPDRSGAVVLDLSETPNANGSVIEALTDVLIAPVAVTTFGASNTLAATGAGFVASTPRVTYDSSGNPTVAALISTPVARVGDIARIAGSTSNDGDYVIASVVDADTITTLETLTVEAAAGTVSLIRKGLLRVYVNNADSTLLDFETAEYDIEAEDQSFPHYVHRVLQGGVKLDKETTR